MTSPLGAELLTVATGVLDEAQVTRDVRLLYVVSSISLPAAENCFEVPRAMLVMVGDVVMLFMGEVLSVTVPVTVVKVAEIVVVPVALSAVARPETLIVTEGSDESQSAADVRS